MTSYETNLFNEFMEMEWIEVRLTYESANSWKLIVYCYPIPIYYDNQGVEELIKEYKGE